MLFTVTPFKKNIISGILLLVITGVLYFRVIGYDFVNFDDDLYVTDNNIVRAGLTWDGVKWAFGLSKQGLWQPLTWFSHMLDYQLWGMNAGMHHFTSILIHGLNAVLLFILLLKLSGNFFKSFIISTVFSIHPLNVESVAWISERKNVLYVFWAFVSLNCYVAYVLRDKAHDYILSLFSFALALMAKPLVVTIPFVMLLLDIWPLKRLGRLPSWSQSHFEAGAYDIQGGISAKTISLLVIEKIPFFIFMGICIFLTIESSIFAHNFLELESVPFSLRIQNAIVSAAIYIQKIIIPIDLAIYHPFPEKIVFWQVSLGFSFLLFMTGFFLKQCRSMPVLLIGWLFFLGTMIPVSGIIQGGLWPAWADRYAYLPMIGMLVVLTWGAEALFSIFRFKQQCLFLLVLSCLILYFNLSWIQIAKWQSSRTLFSHALSIIGPNPVVLINLGEALRSEGEFKKAVIQFEHLLSIDPQNEAAYNNLACAQISLKEYDKALRNLEKALGIKKDYAEAKNNMGIALVSMGDYGTALKRFIQAVKIQPDYGDAYRNIALLFSLRRTTSDYGKLLSYAHSEADQCPQLQTLLESMENKRRQ
ncbi:tetratricopeptide repeat protein [Desulfobacterales bacterium HSG17]|nr:tetratricopeptide repeat protein [Desulfobacterales bacterium HSG17]